MSSLNITEDMLLFWCPNKASNFEMQYRDIYKETPLKNIIVFRSGSEQCVYGHDFEDNSRALFEYMVENGFGNIWKLVWLVNNPDSTEFDKWKNFPGVEFISFHWEKSDDIEKRNIYFQNICLAKFIFTTDTSRFAYRRRHDQTVVQLWHGCGIKTRLRFESMKDRYDYMTVISKFYGDLHEKEYGLRHDQILVTGYPKDDWLYKKEKISIENLIGIPKKQHLILWGPTYRKATAGMKKLDEVMLPSETGLPIINSYNALKRLNSILEQEDAALLIKLHPLADETISKDFHLSNIMFVTNRQLYNWGYHINMIMPLFDAFISDYSSAAISYLLLNRPMAFTLDDIKEYDAGRGFNFYPVTDYLPGALIYDEDQFINFIIDICNGIDTTKEKREKLLLLFHDFHDGKNCERVLSFFGIDK